MNAPKFNGRQIPCPLCAGLDLTCIGDQDRHGQPLATDLCRACGHVFTNPQPREDELENYYAERYRDSYKGVLTPKPKHIYRAGLRATERYQRLKPYLSKGAAVLDIGAGGGEFVYLMSAAGYAAQGIEPNRGYAEFAKSEYGIDVTVGTVTGVLQQERSWDAITLHHVLEHLADPIAVLTSLASQMKDDGVLVVEVPNVEARYHGPSRRFHFAHLHTFSSDGLVYAAARAGLAARDVTLQPHTRHINGVFVKAPSQNIQTDTAVAARIKRHLRADTPLRDIFTARPYRRLFANLTRPLKEARALRRMDKGTEARAILDQMYAPVLTPHDT